MADVNDVAAAVLDELDHGTVTTMKMQKLVYFCQAWSLGRTGGPLFDEPIEAWTNGPVVRRLFAQHRNKKHISIWDQGAADRLTSNERAIVRQVVATYGAMSPESLVEITHRDRPWADARAGLDPSAKSDVEISQSSMASFYGALPAAPAEAAQFAEASVRLEGGEPSPAVRSVLDDVAAGRTSADDAVAARLSQLSG